MGEQALALGPESANDLGVQEASQCFDMLAQLAHAQGALQSGDIVARVLLTDSDNVINTGGGHAYSHRERFDTQHDADVLIDAKMPLVWLSATGCAADR